MRLIIFQIRFDIVAAAAFCWCYWYCDIILLFSYFRGGAHLILFMFYAKENPNSEIT